MSGEVELLPLPTDHCGSDDYPRYDADHMHAYARACVSSATEALRAEVERLKSMTAVTIGVGRGDGSLFVHGDYDSIKAAQALVFRAERLAEALREFARQMRRDALGCDRDGYRDAAIVKRDCAARIESALTTNAAQPGETT